MIDKDKLKVGGQAVLEGVMMRSPHSLAVAVRRANGEIICKESAWRSLWERFRFLRWPFLRGSVVLLESLVNGISALNFSAKVAMADEEAEKQKKKREESGEEPVEEPPRTGEPAVSVEELQDHKVSDWVIWGTVIFALGLGIGLFVALPHFAVWVGSQLAGRELTIEELFHPSSLDLVEG